MLMLLNGSPDPRPSDMKIGGPVPRQNLIGRGQCTESSSQRPSTFNNLHWSNEV